MNIKMDRLVTALLSKRARHSVLATSATAGIGFAMLVALSRGQTPPMAAPTAVPTAREVRGAAAVEPLQNEPPAKIIVDPPLAEPLSHGRVVIQYRTENLHIVPVFGPTARAVSPRVGHVHVTVDDAPWVWADASGEPVILNGLPPDADGNTADGRTLELSPNGASLIETINRRDGLVPIRESNCI